MLYAIKVTWDDIHIVDSKTLDIKFTPLQEVYERILNGEQIYNLRVPKGFIDVDTGVQLDLSRDCMLCHSGFKSSNIMSDSAVMVTKGSKLPIEVFKSPDLDLSYYGEDSIITSGVDMLDIWYDGREYKFSKSITSGIHNYKGIYTLSYEMWGTFFHKPLKDVEIYYERHECSRSNFLRKTLLE